MTEIQKFFINKLIFGKFEIIKKKGEDVCSQIYLGKNINSQEIVSLKIQEKKAVYANLEKEAYYLYLLKGFGIPKIISYGFSGNYNILIEESLGKSLEELFQECKKKLSLKTVCFLAQQMLDRMEFIHNKHIIHRDIKPDNFVMGLNNKSDIV